MRTVAIAMSVAVLLCGCLATSGNQRLGADAGRVIDNVLRGATRGSANSVAGSVARSNVGRMVGQNIGAYLDEQGRQQMASASADTARTGRAQQARTSSGSTISTRVARNSTLPTGSAQTVSGSGTQAGATPAVPARECKTVEQKVVMNDGTSSSDTVVFCNGPDGWQPA